MLCPVGKEKQFWLPDYFFKIAVTIPSWTSHSVQFSRGFLSFHNMDGPQFSCQQNFLHKELKARNFNNSAVMYKERSVVELKAFFA